MPHRPTHPTPLDADAPLLRPPALQKVSDKRQGLCGEPPAGCALEAASFITSWPFSSKLPFLCIASS